ncbi:hypothetical protein SDC9_200612 [bioreactor metagenome]|uniref:Uncharacterized protein n=1 Tax=bioreactor metagenome TaxID=1076179 RepID=A0A645IRH2_9ZZZZ
MDASLEAHDPGEHILDVIGIALFVVWIIAFQLKLFGFEKIARILFV